MMEESPAFSSSSRSRKRGGVREVAEVASSLFLLSAFCLLRQAQSIPIYHQSHSEPQFRHRQDNLQHQTQLPRPDLHLHPRVAKQNLPGSTPPFRNQNNENGYWSPNDRYEELSHHPPPNNLDYERHPSFPQPQHQQQNHARNHNNHHQHQQQQQPHRQIPPPHHQQHQPQRQQHPSHLPNPTPYLNHKQQNNMEHPSWNPQINNHQEFHHPNQFQKPLFHQNGHQQHGPQQRHFNPEPMQKRQQFTSPQPSQFQPPSPPLSPHQFQDFDGENSNLLDSDNYPHHQLRDGGSWKKSEEVANEVDAFVDGSEDENTEDHSVRSRSRFLRTTLYPNAETAFVHKSESPNNLEEETKINSGVAIATGSSAVEQVAVEGTCTLTCTTPIDVKISGKRFVVVMDESEAPETLETTMETEDP